MIRIVLRQMTVLRDADATPPEIQPDRLPEFRLRRPVSRIQHRVYDIPVIEGLLRRRPPLKRVEDIGEHMIVTEIIQLITHREQPPARALRLLRHIVGALAGRKHLQPRPQTAVDPDRALRTHHFIAEVKTAAERPADLELSYRSILIPDKPDRMIFRI